MLKTSVHTSESGNVLFLILIAVALFAALSFAVTSSSRNDPGSIDKESNKTNFSVLLQYVNSIQAEVLRMQISEGIMNPLFNDSDECNAAPFDNCLFIQRGVPPYDGSKIQDISGVANGGVGVSSHQEMKDGVLTIFAYLNISDVGEDTCRQFNEFVQIAGIPQMDNQHDYQDLSADVQSQPAVCAENINRGPDYYSILLKAYEAEYV